MPLQLADAAPAKPIRVSAVTKAVRILIDDSSSCAAEHSTDRPGVEGNLAGRLHHAPEVEVAHAQPAPENDGRDPRPDGEGDRGDPEELPPQPRVARRRGGRARHHPAVLAL